MIRQKIAVRLKFFGHREFFANNTTEVLVVVFFCLSNNATSVLYAC